MKLYLFKEDGPEKNKSYDLFIGHGKTINLIHIEFTWWGFDDMNFWNSLLSLRVGDFSLLSITLAIPLFLLSISILERNYGDI